MEKISVKFTLDELDLVLQNMEALSEMLPDDDEDKKLAEIVIEKLTDYTDKLSEMSEYLNGNDWPVELESSLECTQEDFDKIKPKQDK